jgi:hypothetical protein
MYKRLSQKDVFARFLCLMQLLTFVPKAPVLAAVLPVLGTSQVGSAMNAVKSNCNVKKLLTNNSILSRSHGKLNHKSSLVG